MSSVDDTTPVWPLIADQVDRNDGMAVLLSLLSALPHAMLPLALTIIADWLRSDVLLQATRVACSSSLGAHDMSHDWGRACPSGICAMASW